MGRPLSMASFALNHYATGLDPFYFKLTNVFIHLLNGIGIYALTTLLLNFYRKHFQPALGSDHAKWLGLTVAAAWLLHPFNLTSVLYVVQRMTSLSAFFSIWGLVLFVWGRTRLHESTDRDPKGTWALVTGLIIFTPLAVFSKENGALLPILMLSVEITFFNFQCKRHATRQFLIGVYCIAVAIPLAATWVYLKNPIGTILGGYIIRDFTLSERLMTEARVLWFYLHQIVLPSTTKMGLYHDDIAISRNLIQPLTTLFALIGILALLAVTLVARKKAPLIAFGLLFFFAGHVLESSVLALEIAHEHRNYLPMYGILLIVFYYLTFPLKYLANLRLRQAAAVLLIGLFALNTYARAGKWANPVTLIESEVENHPDSPRANGEMADIYSRLVSENFNGAEMNALQAQSYYHTATELSTKNTHGLFGMIKLNAVRNRPINPSWIEELTHRLEQPPYAIDNGPKLIDLVNCQIATVCKLPAQKLEGLLQASLRNPGLTHWSRANIYSALHLYRMNISNDYDGAVEALHLAIEAMPDALEYRLNLIKFLIIKKQFSQAGKELAQLKQIDIRQAHGPEIARLNDLLLLQTNP